MHINYILTQLWSKVENSEPLEGKERKRIMLLMFMLILTCVSCVPENTAVEESGYQDVSISIPIEIGEDAYSLEGIMAQLSRQKFDVFIMN